MQERGLMGDKRLKGDLFREREYTSRVLPEELIKMIKYQLLK